METVYATLTNRLAWITKASDSAYETLQEYWSYYRPGYFMSPAYKAWLINKAKAKTEGYPNINVPGWNGKVYLFKQGCLPVGLFRATRTDIKDSLRIKFVVDYDRPIVDKLLPGFDDQSEKYSYQNRCVAAMIKALPRGGGLILSATGTGKTKIAAQLFSKLPYCCLFIVDTIDLLYQAQEEIAAWTKEEVGIVGNSKFEPRRLTVATIQTLQRHARQPIFTKWLSMIKVVLVDELHEQLNKRNFSLLDRIEPIACYGLTATMQLGQKPIRFKTFSFAGPVIFRFPVKKGMAKGVLTRGRVVQLLFPATSQADDPDIAMAEETFENKRKLNAANMLTDYLVKNGRYVMLLAFRRLHIEALDKHLRSIPHKVAYGPVAKDKRLAAKNEFEAGEIKCLIASGVFKKGISINRVDIGIDLAELPNKNDCLQKFGRLTRLHAAKTSFIYIDVGTQGHGKRAKAARSRARAFRKEQLDVKVIKVANAKQALAAIKKELERDHLDERNHASSRSKGSD